MNPGHSRLTGCRILLGVTGSIAAFKAAQWVRFLVKEDALVTVVLTRAASRFVTPLTFSSLSGNRVYQDLFDDDPQQAMAHITLARENDIFLIAPATAHTIARLACGLADDLLTTIALATTSPVIVCPAMNCNMFAHPATRDNIDRIRSFGYTVIDPDKGVLACGEEGTGRLPEWDTVRESLLGALSEKDLAEETILITAGPTREPLDPARYLSNRSSGRMGYALARTARRRGARVTLLSGPVSLSTPPGVDLVSVTTAAEMHEAVMRLKDKFSVIVKAAAVADFRPIRFERMKIKKSGLATSLELAINPDILQELGRERKAGQLLVGFAAESENHVAEGKRKLTQKNVDLIVVNDILGDRTGFDVETNQVTLVDRNGDCTLPLLSKEQTADRIWDRVLALRLAVS